MEARIQKLLSARGVASRREAEAYIKAGRVTVNGRTARLGEKADPDRDDICLDGVPLDGPGERVYLMLNKPRGYVTTCSDEQGRPTAAELVSDCGARVWPVGRLDMYSEGLLLFTNDGAFTQKLVHPDSVVEKEYLVRVDACTGEILASLRRGTVLEGRSLVPLRVESLRSGPESALLRMVLGEGKNREIRRICEAAGCRVLRLKRIREGPLELGDLKPGTWRYLKKSEISLILTPR